MEHFTIRTRSQNESCKIQKSLFQRGFTWNGGSTTVLNIPMYQIFLNFERKKLSYSHGFMTEYEQLPKLPPEFFLGEKMSPLVKRDLIEKLKSIIRYSRT